MKIQKFFFTVGFVSTFLGLGIWLVNAFYILSNGEHLRVTDIHADTVGGILVGAGLIVLGRTLMKLTIR